MEVLTLTGRHIVEQYSHKWLIFVVLTLRKWLSEEVTHLSTSYKNVRILLLTLRWWGGFDAGFNSAFITFVLQMVCLGSELRHQSLLLLFILSLHSPLFLFYPPLPPFPFLPKNCSHSILLLKSVRNKTCFLNSVSSGEIIWNGSCSPCP